MKRHTGSARVALGVEGKLILFLFSRVDSTEAGSDLIEPEKLRRFAESSGENLSYPGLEWHLDLKSGWKFDSFGTA
jgi:hypothetical protein